MIISGFPGIGKSRLTALMPDRVSDSDSSKFDRIGFPDNYIEHIKEVMQTKEFVMVSSHDVVRKALVDNNIPFTLCYPAHDLKSEYMERYRQRGNTEGFLQLMDDNWDKFLDSCVAQQGCSHIILSRGVFLVQALGLDGVMPTE